MMEGFQKAYIRGEIVVSGVESVMSVTGALRISHSDAVAMPVGTDTHKALSLITQPDCMQ